MLMTLGARHGDSVDIASNDPAALKAIAELVAQDLDTD
jgi:phosphotransferase system HPr-like phosphotransfer protein